MDLKISKLGPFFMFNGRLFHNVGPATEKARSPLVFNFDGGTASSFWVEDLSTLFPEAGGYPTRSAKYEGANPLRALKTKSRVLKSILKRTGSQCSLMRAGVICWRLRVPVMSRAAAFWTICKRDMADWGKPRYKELQ